MWQVPSYNEIVSRPGLVDHHPPVVDGEEAVVPVPVHGGRGVGLHSAGDVYLLPCLSLDVGLLLLYDRGICKGDTDERTVLHCYCSA